MQEYRANLMGKRQVNEQTNKQTLMMRKKREKLIFATYATSYVSLPSPGTEQTAASDPCFVIESNGATSSERLQSTKFVMDRNRLRNRRLQ